MAEVRISQDDIDSLGEKLSRLEPELSEPEHALLLFMSSLATDAINRSRAEAPGTPGQAGVVVLVAGEDSAPSVRDQFATAFTAGAAGHARTRPQSIGPGPAPN